MLRILPHTEGLGGTASRGCLTHFCADLQNKPRPPARVLVLPQDQGPKLCSFCANGPAKGATCFVTNTCHD